MSIIFADKFYVMNRTGGPTKELNAGLPINVVIVSHILSFVVSAAVEGAVSLYLPTYPLFTFHLVGSSLLVDSTRCGSLYLPTETGSP